MKRVVLTIALAMLLDAKVFIVNDNVNIQKNIKSYIEIKNQNLIRQKEDFSCGSASLATILKYFYNQNVSEKDILDRFFKNIGITKDNFLKKIKEKQGLSFLDLAKISTEYNFKALGLALNIDMLKKLQVPVILYVKIRDNEHFTVYKGMDSRYVYLADPSYGNTKIRVSRFEEMFYQREDSKYRGKILAILPLSKDYTKNQDFLKLIKDNNLIEEVIKSKIIQ